mmetsp:Transcript_25546/g.38132  ORF Transcript_25546/g.38132 Transcript_25546/m.38132 type:complete len:92 (+) Transcript_25546:139-414(+)
MLASISTTIRKTKHASRHLCGAGALEVGNQILPLLGLLETGVYHLGSLDVLLGVLKVFKEGILSPDNTRLFVGGGVGETGGLSRLTAEESV